MTMWGIILLVVIVFGITMIGFGFLFERHSPKKINFVFGYRSFRSMKNQETWDYCCNLYSRYRTCFTQAF